MMRLTTSCFAVLLCAAAIGCTDDNPTTTTTGGGGDGGDAGATSASGGGGGDGGGDGGSVSSTGGGGGMAPTGAPVFVAQGHFARTTISCDEGQSWVGDQSSDDTTQCWSNSGMPDCDHAVGSARGITFGEGWFVATFGWGAPGSIRRSRDGVTWESVTTDTSFAGVAYGNGTFMAGDFAPSRSTDGAQTWTELAYVVNQNVRRTAFVAAAGGLFVMATDGPFLFTSDAGDNWWEPTSYPATCGQNMMFSGGVVYGNDTVVSVNGDGLACRSTDGAQTFTSVDLGANPTSELVFDGTQFMVWSNGNVHTSTDGAAWTTTATNATFNVGPVARSSDGTLVTINDNWQQWYAQQVFYRSTDGITWDALAMGTYAGSHPIFDIAFGHVDEATGCN